MALRQEWPDLDWVAEHKFEPKRKWRFDFACPALMIAVEIEGGSRSYGRHNRHDGFVKDIEKYNHATVLGWRLLRCIPADFDNGRVFDSIRAIVYGPTAS
ncbi:MAG: hypothetical protein Fues2KO_51960 [Fuerstiella sp.]